MQQPRAYQVLYDFGTVTDDHGEDGPGLLRRLANLVTMVRARLHRDSGHIQWND